MISADDLRAMFKRMDFAELKELWLALHQGYLAFPYPSRPLLDLDESLSVLAQRPTVILQPTAPLWKLVVAVYGLDSFPAVAERLVDSACIQHVWHECGVIAAVVVSERAEAVAGLLAFGRRASAETRGDPVNGQIPRWEFYSSQ